jgi:hypothetical protein
MVVPFIGAHVAAYQDRRQTMLTSGDAGRLDDLMHCPVGHLRGALPDDKASEQAAQSLSQTGFTDVVVFNGPPALPAIEADEHAVIPLARARTRLSAYVVDPDGREDDLNVSQ